MTAFKTTDQPRASRDRRRGQNRRDAANQQVRRESAAVRDIGELPPIADVDRRVECLRNLRLFKETYFPARYYLPFSPDHVEIISLMQLVATRGDSFAIAMERSGGKTTICETSAIFAICGAYHSFEALIAANKDNAEQMLASIVTEFETNELLAADFPEICFPLLQLDGQSKRCRGQTYNGERTAIQYKSDLLVLPTIKPAGWKDQKHLADFLDAKGYAKTSGATIKCRGIEGGIRGMKRTRRHDGRVIRPTLAIVDDPQTEESAYSDSQCDTREQIIKRAIRRLAGAGQKTAVVVPCTVIRRGDLADRLIDQERNPEYQGRKFKMLYAFPKNLDLWEGKYDELRRDGIRAGKGLTPATAFYKRNKKKMRTGAKESWPDRFDREAGEIDGLQFAMNLYLEDRGAFAAECQQEPLDETETDPDILDADDMIHCLNGYARGVVPIGFETVVCQIDVQQDVLFYWVIAWQKATFSGHVIEYGTFPEQSATYFTKSTLGKTLSKLFRGAGVEGRIFAGLKALIDGHATHHPVGLGDRVYKTTKGGAVSIERIGIDSRFKKQTVFQFVQQSRHRARLLPTMGFAVKAGDAPIAERKPKQGDQVGPWYVERPDEEFGVRKLNIDTNSAKTFLHARFATSEGDPGSLRFYGRIGNKQVGGSHHRRAVDSLCRSEKPAKTWGHNRHLTEWHQPPSAENDDFDCAAGCVTLASRLGCRLSTEPAPLPAKRRTKPISATPM